MRIISQMCTQEPIPGLNDCYMISYVLALHIKYIAKLLHLLFGVLRIFGTLYNGMERTRVA